MDRWLALLETANPQSLDVLCELIAEKLDPTRVTFEQAVKLASSRPLPWGTVPVAFSSTRLFSGAAGKIRRPRASPHLPAR